MNIAICDDNPADARRLKEQMESIGLNSDENSYYEFFSGKELLEHYQSFDIIFLDIQMGGEFDGKETAEQIRKQDSEALLSFYTAYDYPASDIMQVHPFCYLVKEWNSEKIKEELKKILEEAKRRQAYTKVPILYYGNSYIISSREILYIDIFEKGSGIYLTEKGAERIQQMKDVLGQDIRDDMVKSSIKLGEYYEMLKEDGFAYAKKSYILNLHHIITYEREFVTMKDGTKLNVARSKRKEFEGVLGRYWRYYGRGKR